MVSVLGKSGSVYDERKQIIRSAENTRIPAFPLISFSSKKLPEAGEAYLQVLKEHIFQVASGLAGFFILASTVDEETPRTFADTALGIHIVTGRMFINKLCPIPLHVRGSFLKMKRLNPPWRRKALETTHSHRRDTDIYPASAAPGPGWYKAGPGLPEKENNSGRTEKG
ncbi:MAG: hypothetical protein WAP32_01195 [Candidatus Methanoculleus thermohydrogenotrophicum]|jgi:hypothetical protein